MDFRAVWRRLFKGIELREYDNLVVRLDPDKAMHAIASRDGSMTLDKLQGKRFLRVVVGKEEIPHDDPHQRTGVLGSRRSRFS